KLPDIWGACPTMVDVAANGLPAPGSEGVLYVGSSIWGALDSSARLYSPGLKWPQELGQRWDRQREALGPDAQRRMRPEDLAFDTLGFSISDARPFRSLPTSPAYHDLAISVDRLRIIARVPGQDGLLEFELFEDGAPPQVLDLSTIYSTLLVRDPGTGQYQPVRMQILHAKLHGIEPQKKISACLDVLDPRLSDAFQVLDFRKGGNVVLKLSQRGFALFGRGWHPISAAARSDPEIDNSRVVTFLARPADGVSSIPPDGDNAIELIRQVIEPYVGIREVSSLAEIARDLSELEFVPDTIQIIGHGAPGTLSLGYFWNPAKYTDDDGGPFYLLDSNPYAYGVLMPHIAPPTTVLLAGCFITSDQPSPWIADGRALVSDLHAMWGCDVLAGDDRVGPQSFRDGVFVGSRQGYVGNDWKQLPGSAASPAVTMIAVGRPGTGSPPKLTDLTIIAAPALGSLNRVFLERTGSLPSNLFDDYAEEVELGPLLAMNEISFRGRLGETEVQLHVICDGRFLKVVTGGDPLRVRYFRKAPPMFPTPPSQHVASAAQAHVLARLRENQLRRLGTVSPGSRAPGNAPGGDACTQSATPPTASPRPMTNGQPSGSPPSPPP
ncbi:MAG TPA: hypothetical protein VGD37_43130, partial [Kofleriaceae bacterium]